MKEKKWLRYLCLFALALLVAIPAAGVRQAQAATVSGSCGDSATYEYDEDTGKLIISGSGTIAACYDWENIDDIYASVKKVVIGDKITAVGDYAFNNFSSLKTVTLGAKVKSIGSYAFTMCSKLTTVDMGESAVTKIGEGAFLSCTKLKTVTFSKKLTTISAYAFYYCSKLTSISLPSTLKKIGERAFSFTGLTSVTIPKSVTAIGSGVFAGCSDLTAIKVSSGNTKYCAKSGILYNKDKTKLIAYPAGKASTSFTIPGTVTTISGYAFQGASALTSVKLNKVTKIGAGAFAISGLKSVTITKYVTSIGTSAFAGCTKLTKITVSGSNTKYSSKDGVLYNKAKTKLIQYPLGKSGTSFTIPSSVKKIADGAFYGSTKLTSVEIGEKVTEIGEEAFANCTALTSISIPDNVTTIEAMAFAWCTKLKSVTIGTGVETIGYYAFYDCSALKNVKFKGAAPEFAPGYDDPAIFGISGKSVTIKYPSSEKSSWTKSLRSTLKTASKNGGCATLTFKSY